MSPSPSPITMWMPAMAEKPAHHGTVPDQTSWAAQPTAARTVEHQPANARAVTRPRAPGSQRPTRRNTA